MNLSILNEWGTFFAAFVAAGTGIITVWRQRGGDKIHLGYGSLETILSPGVDLYVINLSAHQVHLQDYGAVLFSGALDSFPAAFEVATLPGELSGYLMKSYILEPYAKALAGLEYSGQVAGVYAYTATQWRPRIAFASGVSWSTKMKLRCTVWWRAWGRR